MAKKFLGLQYPLVHNPRGLLAQKSGVEQIKADLLQLILTNPGERCMLPEFGVSLRTLLFEPNDPMLEAKARQMIADAIIKWEPRIKIQDVRVSSQISRSSLNPMDPGDDVENILSIVITFYDPQNISEVNELVMQVSPLGAT